MLDIALYLAELLKHSDAYTQTKRLKVKAKMSLMPDGFSFTNFPYNEVVKTSGYRRFVVVFDNGYMEALSEIEVNAMITSADDTPLSEKEKSKLLSGEWVRVTYKNITNYAVVRVPRPIGDIYIPGINGIINPLSVNIPNENTIATKVCLPPETRYINTTDRRYLNTREECYIVRELTGEVLGNSALILPETLFDGLFNKVNLQYKWNLSTALMLSNACLFQALNKTFSGRARLLGVDVDDTDKQHDFSVSTALSVEDTKELQIRISKINETLVYKISAGKKVFVYKLGSPTDRVNTTDIVGYEKLKQFITDCVHKTLFTLGNVDVWKDVLAIDKPKLTTVFTAIYECFKVLPGAVQAKMRASESGEEFLILQHKYPSLIQPVLVKIIYNSNTEAIEWALEVSQQQVELQKINLSLATLNNTSKLREALVDLQQQCSKEYIRQLNRLVEKLGRAKGVRHGNTGIAVQREKEKLLTDWKSKLRQCIEEEMGAKFNGKVTSSKSTNKEPEKLQFHVDGLLALVVQFNGETVSVLNKSNTVTVKVKEPTESFITQLAQNCANFCIL